MKRILVYTKNEKTFLQFKKEHPEFNDYELIPKYSNDREIKGFEIERSWVEEFIEIREGAD